MRFSLGKQDGDAEDRPRLVNGNGANGNGSTPSSSAGAESGAGAPDSPPTSQLWSGSESAQAAAGGEDEPAPLGEDRPTLIGRPRDEDNEVPSGTGADAPVEGAVAQADGGGSAQPNGSHMPIDAESPVARTNGSSNGHNGANGHANGQNGSANGAGGAGGAPDFSGGYDEHLPVGEGPTPPRDDAPHPAAGIAVPGAGSSPEATTTAVNLRDKEMPPRPAPPPGATEEEYKWHTYKVYPSGKPDAVEFIDLYKAFGKNRILRGLNMGLPEGMVSMILGPSGTGKSVCIKHMVGLLYPDQGDILVHGRSVPNMVDDELFDMRKKFGLLFQDGALFGSMNLYDNVAFPLRQHTEKGEDEIENTVMRRLNEVGLGHSRDKYPNELSGGMRKRAGFARALVLEPDIVLFDEPDSGLDPVRTSLLGELILEVHRDMMDDAKANKKEHMPTFCVITHNVMMARRTADYINVLWKGRIVEAGPTEDMLSSANPFIRQFLAGESMGPLTMD